MNEPSDTSEYAPVKIANIEIPIQPIETFEIQLFIYQKPNRSFPASDEYDSPVYNLLAKVLPDVKSFQIAGRCRSRSGKEALFGLVCDSSHAVIQEAFPLKAGNIRDVGGSKLVEHFFYSFLIPNPGSIFKKRITKKPGMVQIITQMKKF